jgi:hypothetical protein
LTISDVRLYFILEDIDQITHEIWRQDARLRKPMWFGKDLATLQALVEGLEKVTLTMYQREKIDIRVKELARMLESASIKKFLARFPKRKENFELTIRTLQNRICALGVPMTDAESAAIQEAFRQLGADKLSQLHGSMALWYAKDCVGPLIDMMQWGNDFVAIRDSRGMLKTIQCEVEVDDEPKPTFIRDDAVAFALALDIKLCVQALGTAKIPPARKFNLMEYWCAEMGDLRTMVPTYTPEELEAMCEMGEKPDTDYEIDIDEFLRLYEQYRSQTHEASLSPLASSST